MKKQPSRYLALVLAFLMVVTSLPVTPVMAQEDETVEQSADLYNVDVPTVETTTPPALEIEEEEIALFAEPVQGANRPHFARVACRGCSASRDGDGCECAELDHETIYGNEPMVEPFIIGTPRAPRFLSDPGIHSAAFNLSIHGYGADVRFTTDSRDPVVCAAGLGQAPGCRVASPTCGCSPLLHPDAAIRINSGHGTGAAAANANSPMSVGGIGRANPAPWNVGWSQNADDEDSSYVTPNRAGQPAGRGTAAAPDTVTNARVPNPTIVNPDGSQTTIQIHQPHLVSSVGYFVPNQIYNGMVVRARGFSLEGEAGDITTGTFIVNTGNLNWDGIRILSIVTDPEYFVHPVLSFYRNWDRGMNSWNSRNTENPRHWVNANFYNWESQIRAGMWDGRDHENNPVATLAPNMPTHPGNNLGRGWGIEVPRHTGNHLTCGCGQSASACVQGHLMNVWDHAQAHRPVSNIEVFDENNQIVINQDAAVWAFGNWTRMFPLRSIRINFNQGTTGDVSIAPGAPSLIPGTRRHFYAANEPLLSFRHLQVRNADIEGTDLRDVLSQRMSHPLRPTNQHATFGAVFINGEFWGMHNLQSHRHEHLISETFGGSNANLPRNAIEWINDGHWIDWLTTHMVHPASGSGGRGVLEDGSTTRRRSSTGGQNASHVGDHGGYARVIPATHPLTGQPNAHVGYNHLTREWFDYMDTLICMDDLIDMLIIGMHFENWDWISNNFEGWRSNRFIPGVHGGDRRWRFIVQDFDNAVFHGSNDMLTYFTAMKSPYCLSSCWHGVGHDGGRCWNNREGRDGAGGGFVDMGLPFAIFDLGRSENAARKFRVLLQNPTFRQTFAARYSTYTGTAFHPARAQSVINYYARFATLGGSASPAIGRHHFRWGLFNTNSSLGNGSPSVFSRVYGQPATQQYSSARERHGSTLAPWLSRTNATIPQRAGAWNNAAEPYRWPPHSLQGPNTDTFRGMSLRNQRDVLRLRAAGPGTPGGHARNAIEHMRAYFDRATPTFAISGAGAWGREHNPATTGELGGGTLGAVGAYSRINWRITDGGSATSATSNDLGWLNVAGAHIREDLFRWGEPEFYAAAANSPAGFTPFSIGSFSARYLQNMPVQVTINENMGEQFNTWILTGSVVLVEGSLTDHTITVRPSGTGGTVTADFSNTPQRAPIIHQLHGQGAVGNNAVSHGFIELYNPWNETLTLDGISLQVQLVPHGAPDNLTPDEWEVFPLTGELPARHSFLIVSQGADAWHNDGTTATPGGTHVPAHIITQHDMAINLQLSNQNMSVALVRGNTRLPRIVPNTRGGTILDLVGARNAAPPANQVHNVQGPAAAMRISRQEAARRTWEQDERGNWIPDTVSMTLNNEYDFSPARFADMNRTEIELYRPRSRHDGEWPLPVPIATTAYTTIHGGGYGYSAFHNPAGPGQFVSLDAGEPLPGRIFYEWISNTPGVEIINPECLVNAHFQMPSPAIPVEVTARFQARQLRSPTIVINQVHGQGEPGDNAISHGFIELSNPTAEDHLLEGRSLQLQNDGEDTWNILTFPAGTVLRSGYSFLIVSTSWFNDGTGTRPRPRYIIPEWDMGWNVEFSNRVMTVALVDGVHPLSSDVGFDEDYRIVDLVGAINETPRDHLVIRNYFGDAPAMRQWRQGAARRTNFRNTFDNRDDFVRNDFRYPTNYEDRTPNVATNGAGITNERLNEVRPRSTEDGPWIFQAQGPGTTVVWSSAPFGEGAAPSPATPGQRVNISAGYHYGYEFDRWEIVEGGPFTINDPFGTPTWFDMPAVLPPDGIVLRAHWNAFYQVRVTNHFAGDNSGANNRVAVGDRVTIFAGTRTGGFFFNGWSGVATSLLANPAAAVTHFYMPAHDVEFRAMWRHEQDPDPDWPIIFAPAANTGNTGFNFATWVVNQHWEGSGSLASPNSGGGRNFVTQPGYSGIWTLRVNGPGGATAAQTNTAPRQVVPGNHTLIFQNANAGHADASWPRIHFTVDEFGIITSPTQNAQISINPPSSRVYLSLGTALPAGHLPWEPPLETFHTIVHGFNGVGGATTNPLAGIGRFPLGQLVSVNAGEHDDLRFDGWNVSVPTGGTVPVLANRMDAQTTFLMPSNNVTLTATWTVGGIAEPDVAWPAAFTATFGDRLYQITEPFSLPMANTGTTPGTITWQDPLMRVGGRGTRTHIMRFIPDNPNAFYTVTQNVPVTVLAGQGDLGQPFATEIMFGQPLSASNIVGGSTAGVWSWVNGAAMPAIGVSQHEFTFAPTDTSGTIDWSYDLPTGWTWDYDNLVVRGTLPVTVNDPTRIVTVTSDAPNFTGSGNFGVGEPVAINAGTRQFWRFTHWSVLEGIPGADFDPTVAVQTFAKPAGRLTLHAHFVEVGRTTEVVGGGSAMAVVPIGQPARGARQNPGERVNLSSGTHATNIFSHWTVESGGDVNIINPTSGTAAYFIMPEGPVDVPVVIRSHWIVRHGVTIVGGHAPAGQSGAGNHDVGARVIIFAGTRTGSNYFSGWTGADISLLANPAAPVTYFTMPNRAVTFTASWRSELVPGDITFPLNFRPIVNNPLYVRGTWFDGHVTQGGTNSSLFASMSDRTVASAPASFTLRFGNAGSEHHTGDGRGDGAGRVMHVTVSAGPTVVAPAFSSDWGWNSAQNQNTGNGRISHNPSIAGITFLSYGASIPAGHTEGPFRPVSPPVTNSVTVNGAHGITTGAGNLTGAGTFPVGQVVAINAGTRDGYRFTGWTVNAGGVTLANSNNLITTFAMPNAAVTVTANWSNLEPSVVNWPTLSATFGQTLADITLPANTGTAGTFSWTTPPGNNIPVGTVTGSNIHSLTFTPAADNFSVEVNNNFNLTVLPATPPTLELPTAAPLVQGQQLSASVLSGGSTVGTWAWQNPTTQPAAGTNSYPAVFTPADAVNYAWEAAPIVRQVPLTVTPTLPITVNANIGNGGTGTGAGASPAFAAAGTTVWVDAGAPADGYMFTGWTVVSGGVTIANPTGTPASFEMGSEPVTVLANWGRGNANVSPANFELNNDNRTQTVGIGGTAQGELSTQVMVGSIPDGVNFVVNQTARTIVFTGTLPTNPTDPAIIGNFTMRVFVGDPSADVYADITVGVNLTYMLTAPAFDSGLVIRQIFGSGATGGAGASHGFIEIYNPTNAAIPISGFSVQIQTVVDPGSGNSAFPPNRPANLPWGIVPLTGAGVPASLAPGQALLIISTAGVNAESTRQVLADGWGYDISTTYVIGNRGFSVALVGDTNALPAHVTGDTWNRVIDMVGAINTAGNASPNRDRSDNFIVAPAAGGTGISGSQGIRRINVTVPATNNFTDFTSVRYAELSGADWTEARPRWSGYVPRATFPITVNGGIANREVAAEGDVVTLFATPASGYRFESWNALGVTVTQTPNGNRATFVMPAAPVTVNAVTTAIQPGDDIVLVEIARTENLAAADINNSFLATGGYFRGVSNLTAWSEDVQRVIGTVGTTARAPMVFNNFPDGWRAVNHTNANLRVSDIGDASAFQIRFATEGFENIRFSARQRSTGSGPDLFSLAFRVGSTGDWISVADTLTTNRQSPEGYRNDNMTGFDWDGSQSFDEFVLPADVADNAVVYLRLYMRNATVAITGGNTSINDIVILGDAAAGPSISASPSSVAITDGVPLRAVALGARYANITGVNYTIPSELQGFVTVTHIPAENAITVQGIRPTTNIPDINGMFNITVNGIGTGDYAGQPVSRTIPVTVNLSTMWEPTLLAPSIIIHQFYGQGGASSPHVSHGFIELFNPTNADVYLGNYSVQIQANPFDGRTPNANNPLGTNPGDRNPALAATPTEWMVLNLPAYTMQPNTSFLIVSGQGVNDGARLNLEDFADDTNSYYDIVWNVPFSNRNMSVAIVNNTAQLSPVITGAQMETVIDLVGAANDGPPRDMVHNHWGMREGTTAPTPSIIPSPRISNSEATRRIWDGNAVRNTRVNETDFVSVRYNPADGGISDTQIAVYRPRHSGDGAWPGQQAPPTVTVDVSSVTIDNDNLTRFVVVGGAPATVPVTISTDIPAEMEYYMSVVYHNGTITVQGIRPTAVGASFDEYFTVTVQRGAASTTVTVNVNLSAPPPTFAVNVTGGTPNHHYAAEGQMITLTLTATPPTGYQHLPGGWTVTYGTDNTPVTLITGTNSFIMPAGIVTATVAWTIIPDDARMVTLTNVDGAGSPNRYMQISPGQQAVLNPGTRAGHNFTGWTVTDVANAGTNSFEDLDLFATTTPSALDMVEMFLTPADITINPGSDPENPLVGMWFTMPDADVTVQANWALQLHQVVFDFAGGLYNGETQVTFDVEHGGSVTPPDRPTRSGFTFIGWLPSIPGFFANVTESRTFTADWDEDEIPDFILGDVDGDNRVTSADATLLARFVTMTDEMRLIYFPDFCTFAADINGDGAVNSEDVVLLARWLAGHQVQHLLNGNNN